MLTVLVLYAVLGAVAGLLAGLLGVGGGIVIVPMLIFAFQWQGIPSDMSMHLALGTSMGSILFTSISSALTHHRKGFVKWSVVKVITPGILLGTYAGTIAASHLPSRVLQGIFVIFIFYVATQLLSGKKPLASRHLPGKIGISCVGSLIGIVSSFVGIGGGTLSVPFMLWHNIPVHLAIGTSAAIGFPIALAGSLGYIFNGYSLPSLPPYTLGFLYLPALAGIVAVSIFTAPLGALLAHKLPVNKLKKCFAILLFAVGVKMFFSLL